MSYEDAMLAKYAPVTFEQEEPDFETYLQEQS